MILYQGFFFLLVYTIMAVVYSGMSHYFGNGFIWYHRSYLNENGMKVAGEVQQEPGAIQDDNHSCGVLICKVNNIIREIPHIHILSWNVNTFYSVYYI